ncbi:protein lethal(2)essential for life-like [Sitophilus oryzae]|uniref:Protein lethal(2)essential for life-like n=1 Tax=Sitophilus oryzae TaxID=7048 RepID=A0A6J2Y0P6_SITOR|nr:protein lethal(2)essential for life-like [Sitophilus oryzae]
MSLFLQPFFFNDPVCTVAVRPSRILDQHFGLSLDPEDLLQPLNLNNQQITHTPAGYLRRWRSRDSSKDSGSVVKLEKDQFQANLDVEQFKPEEITVKVTGENVITVEGKHEEKQDNHGYISRHFVRRYVVPKNYDIGRVESRLSSDGVLSITAPVIESKEIEHKEIPVSQTGEPAKQKLEEKK